MSGSTDFGREGVERRLTTFLGVLFALVSAFSIGTWIFSIDILTLGPLYMFTPFVAAVAVCYREGISFRRVGLRVGRKRWIVIAALWWPPVALFIAMLSVVVPGVRFDPSLITAETGVPDDPLWMIVGFVALVCVMILIGVTVNAVLAFGEEFGWRGYLLWELSPLGFWRASASIGVIWGLWHAPLVLVGLNYPHFPIIGIAVFTLVCVLLSPIYTYLVFKGGSVLPAAVCHGVFNATGLAALAGTDSPVLRELVASPGGAVGIVVFALVLFGIWWSGPPEMGDPFTAGSGVAPTDRPAERIGTRAE